MPIPGGSAGFAGPAFAYGETVVRQRAATSVDPYSSVPRPDWTLPTADLDIAGCAVWQESSTEPLQDARDEVVTFTMVALPTGSDVLEHDRLVIRGALFDVFGDPFDWQSPFTGWRPGLVARCRKVEG